MNDGSLSSGLASVSIEVTPVNDAPSLGHLTLSAAEHPVITDQLLASVQDVDGSTLVAAIVATG